MTKILASAALMVVLANSAVSEEMPEDVRTETDVDVVSYDIHEGINAAASGNLNLKKSSSYPAQFSDSTMPVEVEILMEYGQESEVEEVGSYESEVAETWESDAE